MTEATRARVTFVLVAGSLLALYEDPFATGLLVRATGAYLRLYAAAAGAVLHVINPAVSVYGDVIQDRSAMTPAIVIVRGCDAAEMMILYAAAVAATHGIRWPRLVLGLAAGWTAIVAANIARLCCMYYLNIYARPWMDTFHYEVFPLILILTALGAFVAWRRWFARPPPLRAEATA